MQPAPQLGTLNITRLVSEGLVEAGPQELEGPPMSRAQGSPPAPRWGEDSEF